MEAFRVVKRCSERESILPATSDFSLMVRESSPAFLMEAGPAANLGATVMFSNSINFPLLSGSLLLLAIHCRYLSTPANGYLSSNKTIFGTKVTFSCADGYRLKGHSELTCFPNGTWSNSEPSCASISRKQS